MVCVDAIQFARQSDAAYSELLRVLAPAGRVALTSWEAVHKDDERLPERLRLVALRDGLSAAGFADVQVAERPAWRARERSMREEAAALDPGNDPALCSLHEEGVRTRPVFDLLRRVLATATAPRSY